MKSLLLIIGLIAIATGGLWIGQGLGWIAWPQESFMINEIKWSWNGAGLAALGLALVIWSLR